MVLAAMALTGCSGKVDYDAELTRPIQFLNNKATAIEIAVTEKGKPASNLDITGELEMAEMDHGTIKADFIEGEKGVYKTEAKLPMAGKYTIALKFKKDGHETETILEAEVKKPDGVATINGEPITKEHIEFYRFINKLHTAINRERDKEKYSGKELEDALAYWDAQDKVNENQNQLLTQIIRLRSAAMLAEEKGHKATAAEVDSQLEDIKEQYEKYEIANQMIAEYGSEKFWKQQQTQYEMIVLTQKVQQDVISLVKKENPKANEQEINYLAQKKYEELLVSQVNSLDIQIL